MVRSPDAPVEAPKFLGHGKCETSHHQGTIRGPNGSATADAEIIGAQVWGIVQATYSDDFTDMRGVSIGMDKVESAEVGGGEKQTTLPFAPAPSREVARVLPDLKGKGKAVYLDDDEDNERELERDQALGLDVEDPPVLPTTPTKPRPDQKSKPSGVAHITKQLAPSRNRLTSPTKYNIFTKRESTPISVSATELQDLGIDPEIFFVLPTDIQKEQLAQLRMISRQNARKSADPGSRFGSEVREERQSRSRSASVSNAHRDVFEVPDSPPHIPNPIARKVLEARIVIAPKLKKARTVDELEKLIGKWVDSGVDSGPEDGAVLSIRDFMVECLRVEGDVALEKVTSLLKWWRYSLQSKWPQNATAFEVGTRWWAAFTLVKAGVDEFVRGRFGGSLVL